MISVCHISDVPILGCEPEIASLYSSKSGARRIFEDANVDRGPSDADIYTIHQVICLTIHRLQVIVLFSCFFSKKLLVRSSQINKEATQSDGKL